MSDIIARAKDALEHSSPRPWKMDLSSPNMNGQNFCIRTDGTAGTFLSGFATRHMADLPLIEAAPELAQALAEETYQYGVAYTGLNHGGQHIQWVEPTGDTEWDKETLQLLIKRWKKQGQSPKTVRRRVSPPEVINE